jgi:hypothetical protein
MSASERIIFQPYRRGKRGNVVAGVPTICKTSDEAQRRADKAMAGGDVIGAHVVRMTVDTELGEYSEPEYLSVLGVVPDLP